VRADAASASAAVSFASAAALASTRSASSRSRRWISSARPTASRSSPACSSRSSRASSSIRCASLPPGLEPADDASLRRSSASRALLASRSAAAACLRLAPRLLDLAGQPPGDPLQLVDPLERGQQPRDDRGRVVEIADRLAVDARVGVGQRLLALGVLAGAILLAADQLLLDPRGRRERAEGDHRAGGAPAVPRLRLGIERGAQRADDDRVLLAHAQQHQVHRQLEREVLEEQREVEALVELDRDEDGLEREPRAGRRVARVDLHQRARVRRVAGGEEPAPLLGVVAQRAGEQVLEERVPERFGRLPPEQDLGGLGPFGDGALAVGEDEPAADDLLEQRVERVVRDGFVERGRRGRRSGARRSWRRDIHAGTGQERNGSPLDRPNRPEP
jgi:hypothetical protein